MDSLPSEPAEGPVDDNMVVDLPNLATASAPRSIIRSEALRHGADLVAISALFAMIGEFQLAPKGLSHAIDQLAPLALVGIALIAAFLVYDAARARRQLRETIRFRAKMAELLVANRALHLPL